VPWAEIHRLLNTAAVRVSLRYALLYAVFAGGALGAFYWATSDYLDAQLQAGLKEDFQSLRDRMEVAGSNALVALIAARTEGAKADGRYYLLENGNGDVLAGNLLLWGDEADMPPLDGHVHVVWLDDEMIPSYGEDEDAYWPVIGTTFPDHSRLLVARSVYRSEQLQQYSLAALVALLGIIVFLALTMGVFLGRSILRRIDVITATTSEIMTGDLSRRVPIIGRGDEFDALSIRLNLMLERVETLVDEMREVTDNIAHDLRSPLTRLRNRLEVTLLEPRGKDEYMQAMEQSIQDVDKLMATFNVILQTAQADAGTIRAAMETVDLSRLLVELGELYTPLVDEQSLRLTVDVPPGITLIGNRGLLAQAIGNLIDNAVKFTPAGGEIHLAAARSGPGVTLFVADTGPGIAPADRGQVTKRFVRLDGARSTPGNGLGLSLVEAIVRQHGAILTLDDNQPGLLVTITFPPPP